MGTDAPGSSDVSSISLQGRVREQEEPTAWQPRGKVSIGQRMPLADHNVVAVAAEPTCDTPEPLRARQMSAFTYALWAPALFTTECA